MSLVADWDLVRALPLLAAAATLLIVATLVLRPRRRNIPPPARHAEHGERRAPWQDWLREINDRGGPPDRLRPQRPGTDGSKEKWRE